MIKQFLKQLFCWHPHKTHVRNIYGDEINWTGKRSVWRCDNCNKVLWSDRLDRWHKD